VPIEDYKTLIALSAGNDDHRSFREIMEAIDAGEETFPDDFVERLIETESPAKLRWKRSCGLGSPVVEQVLRQGIPKGLNHITILS